MTTTEAQNAQMQKFIKRMEQDKLRLMPLVKYLKKNGLKFKHAGCQGRRVQYFRMDMLNKILEQKKTDIAADASLTPLIQTLHNQLIFYKRPQNSQKLRFPQILEYTKSESGKFASFKFDTTQSKKSNLYLILFAIIACVLFPIWPYGLKYAVWVICVTLLVGIVSLLIIRLVLYIILASLGISFWLFPNIFGDYGIIQSFLPIYSITKWQQRDIFSIILRVLSLFFFVYYCHSIYIEPDFYLDNLESAKEIVKDVHDWGVGKIKGDGANFSQRALTMERILNETQDAFKQESVQYTSFENPDSTENEQNNQKVEEEEKTDDQVRQELDYDQVGDYKDQKEKENDLNQNSQEV